MNPSTCKSQQLTKRTPHKATMMILVRASTVITRGEGHGRAAVSRVATCTRSLSSVTTVQQESQSQQQQKLKPNYQPRFRSATRELQQHGCNALKPSLMVTSTDTDGSIITTSTSLLSIKAQSTIEKLQNQIRIDNSKDRKKYSKPLVSNRKANVLRKQAIVNNTYGTFDIETGIGWDSEWDKQIQYNKSSEIIKNNMISQSGVGRIRVLKPKLSKHYRTRDDRVKQIEQKLIGMDERIEQLYAERLKNKPTITFEYTYDQMVKAAGGLGYSKK
jgi:hypothetical protein